jgi:hypothetical protein
MAIPKHPRPAGCCGKQGPITPIDRERNVNTGRPTQATPEQLRDLVLYTFQTMPDVLSTQAVLILDELSGPGEMI